MRKKLNYLLLFITLCPSLLSASGTSAEANVDRPGADYANFDVPPDYVFCQAACEQDDRCQAYTYVKPGFQGTNAKCWLKSAGPNRLSSEGCISGVKESTRELGWNRAGNSYYKFDMKWNSTLDDCRDYCKADIRCMTYTYMHPHYEGPTARCYLKNRYSRPVMNAACDSGALFERDHWSQSPAQEQK
ncbi:MAG: PAN domain-containing protein [Myxococcota bacterium]